MPMRSVCAATWPEVRLKVIVVGVLAPRDCTDGNPLEALPAANVFGPQLAMRTSCGCIATSKLVGAFRNSLQVPSQMPIFQIVVGCESADERFSVVLPPL